MPTDTEIGRHLDLAPRNVQRLRAEGAIPASGSSLDDCRLAYIRHMREAAAGRLKTNERTDLDSEKARLASEQADQVAMKNAAQRGELVSLIGVRDAMISQVEVMKGHLFRLPARLFPSNPAERERLRAGIESALIDLSAQRAIAVTEKAYRR